MVIRSWDDCVDLGYGRGRAERSTAEAIWRIDADLGRPADVNEAWRSPEQANANRARWLAYERYLNGGPWAPKAPYALGAEDSVHCSGEAADSDDWYDPAAAIAWRRHGFRQTARYPGTARDEPWHGEHRREWELPGAQPAAVTATPIPKEWDEMASKDEIKDAVREVVREVNRDDVPRGIYIWTVNRGGALIDPTVGGVPLAGEEADAALAIYGRGPEVNDRQWDVAVNLATRLAEKQAARVAAALAAQPKG